jgi:hypothetical protein
MLAEVEYSKPHDATIRRAALEHVALDLFHRGGSVFKDHFQIIPFPIVPDSHLCHTTFPFFRRLLKNAVNTKVHHTRIGGRWGELGVELNEAYALTDR